MALLRRRLSPRILGSLGLKGFCSLRGDRWIHFCTVLSAFWGREAIGAGEALGCTGPWPGSVQRYSQFHGSSTRKHASEWSRIEPFFMTLAFYKGLPILCALWLGVSKCICKLRTCFTRSWLAGHVEALDAINVNKCCG